MRQQQPISPANVPTPGICSRMGQFRLGGEVAKVSIEFQQFVKMAIFIKTQPRYGLIQQRYVLGPLTAVQYHGRLIAK
jgi:hypothetical protein